MGLISRRGLVVGAATLAVSGGARAAQRCVPVTMGGVRGCEVGIPSALFGLIYAEQESSQWCWAACIAMVLAGYGHPISQARIVGETFGQIVNMPGSPAAILAALNRPWIDDRGSAFWVQGDTLSANLGSTIQDLSAGLPLIVGTLGHAMVLSAMAYRTHPMTGALAVASITVRDPWPGRGARTLTSQEAFNISFLARIRTT